MIHNKLVRDRIPEIIRASGKHPKYRIVAGNDLQEALLEKLREESDELRRADENERPEELADLLEIIRGLAEHLGLTMSDLNQIADKKRDKRGGFKQGIWLEAVDGF